MPNSYNGVSTIAVHANSEPSGPYTLNDFPHEKSWGKLLKKIGHILARGVRHTNVL